MLNLEMDDIGRDPLTGLSNFFEFVRSDTRKLFMENGVVIIFDMKNFSKINKKYGTVFGDKCLIKLANTIKANVVGLKYKLFRTDGDEFTLILPYIDCKKAKEIKESINDEFLNLFSQNDRVDISLHTVIVKYDKPILSIAEFYLKLFSNNDENIIRSSDKFETKICSCQIIRGFTERINETLTLFDKACNLALKDDISGLRNHRAATTQLEMLKKNADKHGHVFSILFIDGDDLKRYNDVSYKEGNYMIRNLAKIISENVRTHDCVYRWLSGDEFVVVLDETNVQGAKMVGERIRKAVEMASKGWLYPVTISIGVACYPFNGSSIDEVINVAEEANSIAKKSGKNIVIDGICPVE